MLTPREREDGDDSDNGAAARGADDGNYKGNEKSLSSKRQAA